MSPTETITIALDLDSLSSATTVSASLVDSTNVNSVSVTQTQVTSTAVLTGSPGKSAYEVAVANGFSGSQAQWLASLVGPAGAVTPLTSAPIQTANFTALANTLYPVDATNGAITVTLPTSASNQIIDIKKYDASTNIVSISGVINGTSQTIPLRLQNQAKYLVSDQTGGWNAAAGDISLPTLDSRYQATGNYLTALTGDIAATGPGSAVSTLASIISAGSVGSATQIPIITYDAKGRITAVSTAAAAVTPSDATTTSKGVIQLAGDLSGTATAPTVPGLASKAPLASPNFTGTPTVPTPAAGDNTTTIASTAFVSSAVANAVTGTLNFKGSTDASTNPNYPTAKKGDVYVVSVAGKLGGASGVSVDAGDEYFATADNAGGTQASVGSSWTILEHNLVGALLSANNLSDLANIATARTNLGLGGLATQNIGGTTTNIEYNNAGVMAGTNDMRWDNANKTMLLGSTATSFDGTDWLHITDSQNATVQANVQNTSNGTSASSDWVATADTGTNSTNYADMGINSSTYADSGFTISGPLDSYFYGLGGNTVIGAGSTGKIIKFHTGGTLAANERLRITDSGIKLPTGTSGYVLTSDNSGNLTLQAPSVGTSGITRSIIQISAAITGAATASVDYTYYWKNATAYTFSLPTAIGNTNRYTLKNASSVTQTVATTSSQTIDGSTSITIKSGDAYEFISDNANWMAL